MDSKKLARLCREFADNKKAENIVILDVRDLSSVTDYFVIASGTSEPHLRAIVDEVTDQLREEHGVRPRAVDGTVHGAWVVLDFFDVIMHIMRQDARERYDLESLWGDAARVKSRKKTTRKNLSKQPASAGTFAISTHQRPLTSSPAGLLFCGISFDVFTISLRSFLNSSRPVDGMMMVSRRPPTSSVMRRNRPRGFSLSVKTKVLRSI